MKQNRAVLNLSLILLLIFSAAGKADNLSQDSVDNREGSHKKGIYQQRVEDAQPIQEDVEAFEEKLREHKKIEIVKELPVPAYHYSAAESTDADERGNGLCRECHGNLAHKESASRRSYLNQHSGFINCESCHLNQEGLDSSKIDYQWFNSSSSKIVKGVFNIKGSDLTDKSEGEPDQNKSAAIKPQGKITLFYNNKPVYTNINEAWADSRVEQFDKAKKSNTKARIAAEIHAPLKRDELDCLDCHDREKMRLPLQKLGANSQQQKAISSNVIARFIARFSEDKQQPLRLKELLP